MIPPATQIKFSHWHSHYTIILALMYDDLYNNDAVISPVFTSQPYCVNKLPSSLN